MRSIVVLFLMCISQLTFACLFDANCTHSNDDLEHYRQIHGMTPMVTLKVFSDANVAIDRMELHRAAKRYLDRLSRARCSEQRKLNAQVGKKRSLGSASIGPRITLKIRLPLQVCGRPAAEAAVETAPEQITETTPEAPARLGCIDEPEPDFEYELEPTHEPFEEAQEILLPRVPSFDDPINPEDPLLHALDCNCLFCIDAGSCQPPSPGLVPLL